MTHFITWAKDSRKRVFLIFAVFFPLTPPSLPLVYPPTPSTMQGQL